MKFIVIKNNSEVVGAMTLEEYVAQIKTPSQAVMDYRSIMSTTPARAELKKRAMSAVTPAGIFKDKRSNETLIDYSSIVCLDIDHKQNPGIDIKKVKADLSGDRYVLAVHLSLSGTGLAVFVKVDSGVVLHPSAYNQLADYFEANSGIIIDRSCKDLARQRYMAYDPEVYFNPKAKVFAVLDQDTYDHILERVHYTKNLKEFEPGSRNSFVFQLACNSAEAGIKEEDILIYCQVRYSEANFHPSEIKRSIESAYNRVDQDHVLDDGGFSVQSAVSALGQKPEDYINCHFDDSIFPKLPSFLQGYELITSTSIQRDIVLITMLGVLSACLPHVFTIYRGSRNYPNLYFLIYAPPASDKGVMSVILRAADPLDKMLSDDCARRLREYDESGSESDEVPNCKGLYLDADSSSIAMIQNLQKGSENLLADTEGVILSQTRKNDWAQLDPSLRKAFHFERISVSRKDRTITIREPRISLLMTCTVEDAKVFSGSIQGGLTSRILPYSFSSPMTWQNQFSDESSRIPAFIEGKSQELIAIYLFNKENPFELKFTADQKQKHTASFGEWTDELDSGDEFAFLKRLGVATVRIAMILTALRKFEQQNKESVVVCDDDIFEIALSIANTFRCHGANFYKLLTQKTPVVLPRPLKVLDVLPKQFTTQQFVTHCKQLIHINERQSKKHLESMVNKGVLVHIKQGVYEKTW